MVQAQPGVTGELHTMYARALVLMVLDEYSLYIKNAKKTTLAASVPESG